jgi:BirA family biotin operon repressor/biotin-[acetyl-CoA-carboxylase] ligase
MIGLDAVRARLPGRRIEWREVCETTMAEAAALAREGCPSGSAAGAEQQTAGRGRHQRRWESAPGSGLYVSIVLRPAWPDADTPVVSLALGLAAAEAIRETTSLACDLRWPNDVLIGERKCVGILVENEGPALIAGVGVNVNQTAFPGELAKIATSLRIATDREQSREELLVRLLQATDRFTALLAARGRAAIIEAFSQASTYARGKRVVVEQGQDEIAGTTDGLDPSGFLWVRRPGGSRTLILAGGVRPALH